MAKKTSLYNFLYLENGDIIYPGPDADNMQTAENQFYGMYSYLQPGIVDGWRIHWLGCTTDEYAMRQRQALIDAYKTDRFSYLSLKYQELGLPVTELEWQQCVVVTPGTGIIDVFHVATENPSFFRFEFANHYYIWAEKNACTTTEYLCDITAPIYPDEDYDLATQAVYVGEVFTNNIGGNIIITQIIYSERRRELRGGQGDIQRLLKQTLINHVHSGEGNMPSKINLNTNVTIKVSVGEFNNVFTIKFPTGFVASNYAPPKVYLNSNQLLYNQFSISGSLIYLQNNIPPGSSLQIVYELAPGPNIYITSSLYVASSGEYNYLGNSIPGQNIPLDYTTSYYLTDGTTKRIDDETAKYNVWRWVEDNYSRIQVFLKNVLLDPQTYVITQVNNQNDSGGRIVFNGPIFPSVTDYKETDVIIKFTIPSFEVYNKLSGDKIKSIDAKSFTRGTLSNSRITGLDHLGLVRYNEPAKIKPYKKLLDSGDHVHFYPETKNVIQLSDYIVYSSKTKYVKLEASESSSMARVLVSTPNGLFSTTDSATDFSKIKKMVWNTDNGVPDKFAENYFGNYAYYNIPNFDTQSLNPKNFWLLTKSKNQFVNSLYLSTNFGVSFNKIALPYDSSGTTITINDFLYTCDVFQYFTGEVVLTPHLDVRYIYYMATPDGLYSASLTRSQNKTKPLWADPTKNTTNVATGSINKIAEAVNVSTVTVIHKDTKLKEVTYTNEKVLYAGCDEGLFNFVSNAGIKFTSSSVDYNADSSEFDFVKWLGDDAADNGVYGVVWADGSGLYYSNSGQVTEEVSSSDSTTTTTIKYYQPLVAAYTSAATVKCASTENIDLAATISTIDGYLLTNNDNVLLKDQTVTTENGLYYYNATTGLLARLGNTAASRKKVYVQDGVTQGETEWMCLRPANSDSASKLEYALWMGNLFSLNGFVLDDDHVVDVALDKSRGPQNLGFTSKDSFFVATTKYLYRVFCNSSKPNIIPIVRRINWDYENNGTITSIEHFASNDSDNGMLIVFTSNGVYKSTPNSFSYGPLDQFGDLILPNFSYQRFDYPMANASQLSVYDSITKNEYKGRVVSIDKPTAAVSVADGTYLNNYVYVVDPSIETNGLDLTVDVVVSGGYVTDIQINNPGFGFESDIDDNLVVYIDGVAVPLFNLVTEGVFTGDYNSQSVTYSKSGGINPSSLLYEDVYTDFYINPWVGTPLVSVSINNSISSRSFKNNGDLGLIKFDQSLPLTLKDSVTVSLVNAGQYISNTGVTPHNESFNVTLSESSVAASLSTSYDPLTASSAYLSLTNIDNTKWDPRVNLVKITGQRPIANSGILASYSELVQVGVSTASGLSVYIKSKPTTLPLTAGSNVFISRPYNLLGIEDKLTLAKTNLTYHLDSVSHLNVYNLKNGLDNVVPGFMDFPSYSNESLTGINRGLVNTVALNSLSQFDPSATFIGYTFGVEPSKYDVATAPTNINLILSFSYGSNPKFATDKGIWEYVRSQDKWVRVDTLDDSEIIYFADKQLTDSNGAANVYSGTNQGLYYLADNQYTQNILFTEPQLSLNMGSWFTNAQNTEKRFEAYGKEESLSFVLRTKNTQTNAVTFQSDWVEGRKIYDIFYGNFVRYDDKGNKTEHPAVYLATDSSAWAYTTDIAPNAPGPGSRGEGHTLLVGREMFGKSIIRNANKINPTLPGLPSKVYKIIQISGGAKTTWLVFCTSNGVYVVINWKSCDVGDPGGLTFWPQNLASHNETVGRHCYCIVAKTNDETNSTYFVGTDQGVFKSISKCGDWSKVSKFDGKDYSVSDLKYFENSGTGYLVAATSGGLWISDDDGNSWSTITGYSDSNISIPTTPVFGIPLGSQMPEQTFATETSGMISKAFVYFDPSNIVGQTTVKATIDDGSTVTESDTELTLDANSYPGMYGFEFSNVSYVANDTYSLGIKTDFTGISTLVSWGLSNLDNPFSAGIATTSGGALTGQDFFFRINLNTPAQPVETIEPVGFYDSNYSVGFAKGRYSGAALASDGKLYSNIGIVCNVVIDTSKSFEINDTAIVTAAGISTQYLREAIINSLVVDNADGDSLYTRLQNGVGTGKFLAGVYGYNNRINDLLFFSTTDSDSSSDCLSSTSVTSYEGYTNDTNLILNSIDFVSNTGRLSLLNDALLYNSRLQYPSVVVGYYSQPENQDLIDFDYINIPAAAEEYESDLNNYVSLNLTQVSGDTYSVHYESASNPFIWVESDYLYNIIFYTDGTSSTTTFTVDPSVGICTNTDALKTPLSFAISKDWEFDDSTNGLSETSAAVLASDTALDIALSQYAKSFKPLIVVATDGNNNSNVSETTVSESLQVSWDGSGTQVLVIEPSSSGNENTLRDMVTETASKIFKYTSYPEAELKATLTDEDSLGLFASYWERDYDYESAVFISYIFASYTNPGNSKVIIKFKWSTDRINYSPEITLPNNSRYYLNQKVLSIYYRIEFVEDYSAGRVLPYVEQLYHVTVVPSVQTYISYPQSISGQMFEVLASASFNNNDLVKIAPIVGRTASTDTTYYETIQLNRNAALPNRQLSYRVTPAKTITGLKLLPTGQSNNTYYIVDVDNNIYTWTANDTFRLYNSGKEIDPRSYSVAPASGIVIIVISQSNEERLYETYSVTINYAEVSTSIIGEPATTFDYRTYYFSNGRVPTDASVVVLVDQEIYKGDYIINYFDGTVTFAAAMSESDYVTVFIKFADTFRAGLQIESYTTNNLSLQSYNFTYTSVPDLVTYAESFNSSIPKVIDGPRIIPASPNIDSSISVEYTYFDSNNAMEDGTSITWWRQRTGIEYVTYDPSYNVGVTGSFSGISTVSVKSRYNQDAEPFILSVTLTSNGVTTNVNSVTIVDRGRGFIGTGTDLPSAINTGDFIINNLGNAVTAYTLISPVVANYATSDYYVRLSPDSPIGFASTTYAFSGPVYFSSMPDYDGRLFERSQDVGVRDLIDGRDRLFVLVSPSNGEKTGLVYQTNVATINPYYTPVVSNLDILNSQIKSDGISTTLGISSSADQIPQYNWSYSGPNIGPSNFVSWYKLKPEGPVLISNTAILSSSLISLNDQIYYDLYPGVVHTNGTIGFGQTASSEIYSVL